MKPKLSDIVKALNRRQVSDTSKKKSTTKELPTVIVSDKSDSRIKRYNDSLNLYNASISMAKNMAKALSKGAYDTGIRYGESKSSADKRYKNNLDYYTKQLVDPITKGRKPKFGGIERYTKQVEETINDREKGYYRFQKNSKDEQTKYVADAYLKGYEALDKLNKKIKPVSVSIASELPAVPIYKKPIQPVKYKKSEPKKEIKKTEPLKKEQTKTVEKKQNTYEGSPVYSPGAGSGMPSALVGFMGKGGDTTYIKPEDYERFAVPKYGKAFIESKSKKK